MNISEVDKYNLPEEITVTLWLNKSMEYGNFFISQYEKVSEDYLCIAEPLEVTFKVNPREDLTNTEIATLKERASKIRAKAEVQCKQIDEKIQSLLCLEAP